MARAQLVGKENGCGADAGLDADQCGRGSPVHEREPACNLVPVAAGDGPGLRQRCRRTDIMKSPEGWKRTTCATDFVTTLRPSPGWRTISSVPERRKLTVDGAAPSEPALLTEPASLCRATSTRRSRTRVRGWSGVRRNGWRTGIRTHRPERRPTRQPVGLRRSGSAAGSAGSHQLNRKMVPDERLGSGRCES